jgi:hypothetical protein
VDEAASNEDVIVVHRAGSATEAVVIRSLLESAGIASPGSATPDMFPMREPPKGFNDTDIRVLDSQAEDARRIIAEYVAQTAQTPAAGDTDSQNQE